MKLDSNLPTHSNKILIRIGKRNAYHQAGHVVAIHLGNRQKNLPAVHFQLTIKPQVPESKAKGRLTRIHPYGASLEGGRLLSCLPYSYDVATRRLSEAERQECLSAFEADATNLLVGSLAEAKYVALRDDEVFNANLVYLGALRFYGGSADLAVVNEYMACLYPDSNPNHKSERQKKLVELFLKAYDFINDHSNWHAIKQLAEAIHGNPQATLTCDDLIALLEQPVPVPRQLSQRLN